MSLATVSTDGTTRLVVARLPGSLSGETAFTSCIRADSVYTKQMPSKASSCNLSYGVAMDQVRSL